MLTKTKTKPKHKEAVAFTQSITRCYLNVIEYFDLIYNEDDNCFVLDVIVVKKEHRFKGIGTEIVKSIIEFAHNLGLDLFLCADVVFGGNIDRLRAFYKGLGGVSVKGNVNVFMFEFKG